MYRPDGSRDMQISTLRLSVGHTGLLRNLASTYDLVTSKDSKLHIAGNLEIFNFLCNFSFSGY